MPIQNHAHESNQRAEDLRLFDRHSIYFIAPYIFSAEKLIVGLPWHPLQLPRNPTTDDDDESIISNFKMMAADEDDTTSTAADMMMSALLQGPCL